MPQFTIYASESDEPLKIVYFSPLRSAELSWRNREMIAEFITYFKVEFGTFYIKRDTKTLWLYSGTTSNNQLRVHVAIVDEAERTIWSIFDPIFPDTNEPVSISLENNFRRSSKCDFLFAETISLEKMIGLLEDIVSTQTIPTPSSHWKSKHFNPREWFLFHSSIDSHITAYRAEPDITENRLLDRIESTDGKKHYGFFFSTPIGRLCVFSIVEFDGRDNDDENFETNLVHIAMQNFSPKGWKNHHWWILVNPTLSENNSKVSIAIDNGQWDSAEACEVISKNTAKFVTLHLFKHGRLPHNLIWKHRRSGGGRAEVSGKIIFAYNQDHTYHRQNTRPSKDNIRVALQRLDGVNFHRVCLYANHGYVFVHATNAIDRVVLTYFDRYEHQHMRTERMLDRNYANTKELIQISYAPDKFEIISILETISKNIAIEAVIHFFLYGVFSKEWSVANDQWWRVKWEAF